MNMLPVRHREPTTSTLRWGSLRTELYWAYDGVVEDRSLNVTSDHRRGYWLWLLREGEVKLRMGKQVWEAKKGQWLVSPHGSIVQQFSPNAHILSVHFRCEWSTGEDLFVEKDALVFDSSRFPRLERSAFHLGRLVYRHFPGVRLDLLQQTTEYPVFLRVQQRFLQWLIDFYETMMELDQTVFRGGEGDERLWRAAELLDLTPLDADFPLTQLQRETSLGRAQLDRLFWKEFGATTREYWEKLREKAAITSVESTSMSIKEIGYRLGFKQPSHFTKWFSRRVGINPQDYRARFANSSQFRLEQLPPPELTPSKRRRDVTPSQT